MYGRCFKTIKDIATTKAGIRFLTQCTKQKLIPHGFISRPRLHTLKAQKLEHRFAKIRLREQLNHLHAKLFIANLHLENSTKDIPEDIKQDMTQHGNQVYFKNHTRLNKKLKRLQEQRPPSPHSPPQYKLDAVLNLSSRSLSDIEIRVLSLGPKFRPSLPQFPTDDYIYATDQYIQTYNIKPEEANKLRATVAEELFDVTKSNKNMQLPDPTSLQLNGEQ
jgi:hypothetical protein